MNKFTGNYIVKRRQKGFALEDSILFDSDNNEIGTIESLINHKGLSVIKNKNGLGLINENLDIILECGYEFKYNRCGPDFEFGLMVIKRNQCFGIINDKGETVVPCIYPGFCELNKWNDNMLLEFGYFRVSDGQKYGLININDPNQYILDCIYEDIVIQDNSKYVEELMFAGIEERHYYIIGYAYNYFTLIDLLSTKTINIYYGSACEVVFTYDNETIIVKESLKSLNEKYYILIIKNEDIFQKFEYDRIGTSNGRYIQVFKNNSWGLFDLYSKREIIPCEYFIGVLPKYSDTHFCRGFMINTEEELILICKDELYGYINKNNELIVECKFKEAEPFYEGRAAVRKEWLWSFINTDGVIISKEYEKVKDFRNGLAAVKDVRGKWGYVDKTGTLIIPCRFSDVLSFSEGLAPVAFKYKWGYINKYNETIIPFIFTHAFPFKDGSASVSDRGGSGRIDITGRWIEYKAYRYDYDSPDYGSDTWDALTDGMEGDYPGEGVDYDLLGF